jgi:hypothetical protein
MVVVMVTKGSYTSVVHKHTEMTAAYAVKTKTLRKRPHCDEAEPPVSSRCL